MDVVTTVVEQQHFLPGVPCIYRSIAATAHRPAVTASKFARIPTLYPFRRSTPPIRSVAVRAQQQRDVPMTALTLQLIRAPSLKAQRNEGDGDAREERRDAARRPVRPDLEPQLPGQLARRAREHRLQRAPARPAPRRHPPVRVRRPAERGRRAVAAAAAAALQPERHRDGGCWRAAECVQHVAGYGWACG